MSDKIVKSVQIGAPVSHVWKALTDHREFGEWFRVAVDGPFVPGEPASGRMLISGYEHLERSPLSLNRFWIHKSFCI